MLLSVHFWVIFAITIFIYSMYIQMYLICVYSGMFVELDELVSWMLAKVNLLPSSKTAKAIFIGRGR